MVSFATKDDLPALAEIGKWFFLEGKLPGKIDPAIFVKKWSILIDSGVGFILKQEKNGVIVGALGFIVIEDINDGAKIAGEAFWFVLQEYRGRGFELLIKYEREAEALGCQRIGMVHLESIQPERLSKLYVKRGYKKTETAYIKNLI